MRILGPILGFRGVKNGGWHVSILTATEGDAQAESFKFSVDGVNPVAIPKVTELLSLGDRRVWRHDFSVPQDAEKQRTVQYMTSGGKLNEWRFTVPALDAAPRMTFFSCNGFSNPRDKKKVPDHNAMWKRLKEMHGKSPYHLMIMGGDQVYADTIWEVVPSVKAWSELPVAERFVSEPPPPPAMEAEVREFYFNLYLENWNQADRQGPFSAIPTMMMWDDHDIFDGWGSYPEEQQKSSVFQLIFRIAKDYFRAFQMQCDDARLDDFFLKPTKTQAGFQTFSYAHRVGNVGLLCLDLRSERTADQVVGGETWDLVYDALGKFKDRECDHLLVVTSIPVVHPDFSLIEGLLNFVPGQQELEDDLRDHWHSRPHKEERIRLIHRLFNFSAECHTRVTLLSGDVHVAAMGVIETDRAADSPTHASVINQLTSSAIVHPPPPAIMGFALEQLGSNVEEVDTNITARMLLLTGLRKRFIGARNWLSIEPDDPAKSDQRRLWANWYVEGETKPYTKVVHAIPLKETGAAG